MTAFIVETSDDKHGTLWPNIVGPFATIDDAVAFCHRWEMGQQAENGMGGYSAAVIVSAETCDYSPEEFARREQERLDEYGVDEDDPDYERSLGRAATRSAEGSPTSTPTAKSERKRNGS